MLLQLNGIEPRTRRLVKPLVDRGAVRLRLDLHCHHYLPKAFTQSNARVEAFVDNLDQPVGRNDLELKVRVATMRILPLTL